VALRWDRRRIALLRVVLGDAGGGEGAALPWSRGIEIIVDKVRSLGGTLDGISPDSAEASFGVDPIEEPTIRAAHAALAIRRELRTARLHPPGGEVRVGIHAGEVLVARAGGAAQIDAQSRREIAPRLEALIAAADPESIVVDAATAAFLRRRFVLAPAGRPGSDPALYRVVRHEPLALDGMGKIAPFVGRRQELAILQDRLQAALAGRGQVVAVLGHPGVGKSRLVWEFTRSADVRPARLLVTGCADASKTPYQPVIELVRRYAGLGFDDDAQVIRERLGRALASAPEDLASSLPALLALFDIRSDEWDALDPVERRHRTLSAAKQLLLAESRVHPLVVVVDDMHWIDSESQAFLDALVEGLPTAPVMLVVTYRPEGRHAWGHLSYYSQLHVDSLPRASALQLLENLLGTDPSLEPVAQHVVARTDGNPLFLEESIQALIETGVLKGERGAYRATRSALPGQVPATIEAILATRIERLGPGDKALVQSAAAIGAEVPIGVLSAIVDLAPEALREEVRRLQAAELLYEGSSPMGNGFVFKHALTREVAYGSLQPDERRALHRRILAAMGAMARDSALESIDRLAHHAFQGELWTEAVAYLKQAGDRAMGAAAVREAAQYFAQALEALGHLPESQRVLEDVVDLRLRRRDALWTSLELDALRENLREAERIAEHLHDQTRGGWVACYHCHYFWAVGDLARALPAGQRALDIAGNVNNPALRAESSFYCGLVQQAAGDFRQSVASLSQTLHALERAISIANPEFPSRRFALTGPVILRSFLVRALAQLGEFREALACGADAMALADASGNPFALVAARGGVGNARVRKGEPAQAIQVLEPGLRVCRAYGLRQWLPTLGGALGLAYVQTGRIDEGLALLQECVECGSSLGLLASASAWEINLGEAYLRAGRRGEARSVAHRVLAACRTRRERGYEAWALVLLAEVEAAGDEPDLDSARARYEEAIALGTERGMRPLLAHCQRGLGQLAARRGQPREAGERLGRAAAAFREIDMTWPGE
jgi:tetratricopeptide (TPR) repeat protein